MTDPNYSKLSKILSDLDLPARPEKFTESKLFRDWTAAAGDNIADSTARVSFDNEVLAVAVTSPTWAHALLNNQTTILKRLRDLGYKDLRQMTIQVTLPASQPTPRVHRAAETPRPDSPTRVMTPRLQKLFAEIAQNASNPRTRKTFERLSKIDSSGK